MLSATLEEGEAADAEGCGTCAGGQAELVSAGARCKAEPLSLDAETEGELLASGAETESKLLLFDAESEDGLTRAGTANKAEPLAAVGVEGQARSVLPEALAEVEATSAAADSMIGRHGGA